MRELADKTLDLFAKVAKCIAPDPGQQELTREEAGADLEATGEALNDLAARIGDVTRL